MSTSKVIGSRTVANLANLLWLLRTWSQDDLHTVSNFAVHVLGDNGQPLNLRLIVDTLTDGSKVYNIIAK